MTQIMIAALSLLSVAGPGTPKSALKITNISVFDASCHNGRNGSIIAEAQGGAVPYYYSINGTTFQKDETFKGLTPGAYTLFMKDSKGGTTSSGFTVGAPEKIKFQTPKYTQASCCNNDGAVLVKAIGGTGTFLYQVNEGSYQEDGYFNGLSGGYTITAKDSLGCKASIVIAVTGFSSPVIDFINSTDVSCHGFSNGSVNVFVIGGSGNLSYSINGKDFQKEPSFKNLEAGTYTLTVKDESGCSDSNAVTISEPPVLELQASSSCLPGIAQKNEITVDYSIGGTGWHTFSIDKINYQDGKKFKNVDPGTYTVYVKDGAGCIGSTKIYCTIAAK